MTDTTMDTPAQVVEDPRQAAALRLFGSLLGAVELLTVELGRRLGLYRTLRGAGAVTAAEFAAEAGIAPRYAREWLEQQAAAGFLAIAEETGAAETRRFCLPEAMAAVLVDEDNPFHATGMGMLLTGVAAALPQVAAAFATGAGVPFHRYGPELRGGLSALNRPKHRNFMGAWTRALPDVAERLDRGGRILDAGCGTGWSTVALAAAFPNATVVGVDMDEASIVEAREIARREGVGDRVVFRAENILAAQDGEPGFDLVTVFQALHDMGDPIGALRGFRSLLAPGGAVLVADEKVGESFSTAPDEVERIAYAVSVLHCLPATTAESAAVANGTVLRPTTVRSWAAEAGFSQTTVLPIEALTWRFYRLDPTPPR